MSHKSFVLSAIGTALLVPGLALGLIDSGPSYPQPAAQHAVQPTQSAAHAAPARTRAGPMVIQLRPIVIAQRGVVHGTQKPTRTVVTRRDPDCNATWRTMNQGPATRRVRNLCVAPR
jgi:hypothetical protein